MENLSPNIRKDYFNKELNHSLDNYLNNSDEELFHGDYEALVVDNNDPEKKGRIKVRVYAFHSSQIQESELPWAVPHNIGMNTSLGSICIPENGSVVVVSFDKGDLYLPEYKINTPTTDQLPPSRTDPNNIIFLETKSGTIINFNRSDDTIDIKHKSLAEIKINSNGDITIKASPTGSISLGNAPIVYCNDLPICPILGSHSIGTATPGNKVIIP